MELVSVTGFLDAIPNVLAIIGSLVIVVIVLGIARKFFGKSNHHSSSKTAGSAHR